MFLLALKNPPNQKKPSIPSNEGDRFLEEKSAASFDEYKKANYRKPKFDFNGWKFGLTIAGAIIGALIIILGFLVIGDGKSDLQYAHELYSNIANQNQLYNEYLNKINMANDVISRGVTTLIVGACVASVPAIISLVAAFISHKVNVGKSKKAFEEYYKKYTVKVNTSNKEKSKKRDKAIKDYENYEKALIVYEEKLQKYIDELEVYSIEFEKYQKEYDVQLQLAKTKVETHNKKIEAIAEENFKKSMSVVKIEFPEKYYSSIDKIIDILEDLRADDLKEAISVLKEDEHKENMLSEQRRLVDLQEEYNAELERQGEENARYQQEQNDLQRERIREEQRQHDEMLSFQREQAKQQQEQERIRYEEQRAYQREQEKRQMDAERQERERIRNIRNRCDLCANRFTCSIKNSITSACPSFRSR